MKKKRQPTAEEMLVRMAGLCAGAEQCCHDIRQKIRKQGFTEVETAGMLEYLIANKYIDDSRYARAFATDKVRFSGWGRMKIRMGLRLKGVADSDISLALQSITESDYAESLRKTLETKARSLDMSDIKDRQKLYRHAAARGFESDIIIKAIRSLLKKSGQ